MGGLALCSAHGSPSFPLRKDCSPCIVEQGQFKESETVRGYLLAWSKIRWTWYWAGGQLNLFCTNVWPDRWLSTWQSFMIFKVDWTNRIGVERAEVTKDEKADRSAFELQASHMVRALLSFYSSWLSKPVSKRFALDWACSFALQILSLPI